MPAGRTAHRQAAIAVPTSRDGPASPHTRQPVKTIHPDPLIFAPPVVRACQSSRGGDRPRPEREDWQARQSRRPPRWYVRESPNAANVLEASSSWSLHRIGQTEDHLVSHSAYSRIAHRDSLENRIRREGLFNHFDGVERVGLSSQMYR